MKSNHIDSLILMKTHGIARYGAFTGSAALILALLLPVTVFAPDRETIIEIHKTQTADVQGSSQLAINEVTVVDVAAGLFHPSQTVLIRGVDVH